MQRNGVQAILLASYTDGVVITDRQKYNLTSSNDHFWRKAPFIRDPYSGNNTRVRSFILNGVTSLTISSSCIILRRCIECSCASKVPTIDLFKPVDTMVANSQGQHTPSKEKFSRS